jgi:antitoxin component of MazEF toxin-antitoxin module
MIKTLTKHGNSMALVIEKPILDLLGANTKTSFDITTDGHALVLTPVLNEARSKAFNKALDAVNKKYPKALKKLSE